MKPLALLLVLAAGAASTQPAAAQPGALTRNAAAVTVQLDGLRWLRVGFCGERIARVTVSAAEAFPTRPSLVVVVACGTPADWRV